MLLCFALWTADIIPTGMTALAGEQAIQSTEVDEEAGGNQDEPGKDDEEDSDDHQDNGDGAGAEGSDVENDGQNSGGSENITEEEPDTDDSGDIAEEDDPDEQVPEWNPDEETAGEFTDEAAENVEGKGGTNEEEESDAAEQKSVFAAADIASGTYQNITWRIDSTGRLIVEGTGNFKSTEGILSQPWGNHRDSITSAKIDVMGMTDASYMFYKCSNLKSVDLSGFDTSQITNMSSMFMECGKLESIDLSGFDTSQVKDMSCMFESCQGLTRLDLSGFDTSQVKNMSRMFAACRKMKTIDLSSFDTGNVMVMWGTFQFCTALEKLDLHHFKTDKVVEMKELFEDCKNLSFLDVSSFNTENVTDMASMFRGLDKITELDLSHFDTANVKDMSYMFSNGNGNIPDIRGLKKLNVSSFDTGNVTTMRGMFCYNNVLTELDLSSFDMGKVTDTSSMLDRCTTLSTIRTPCNLTRSVQLPTGKTGDKWYQSDGTVITELPKEMGYGIVIQKNKVPDEPVPYIVVTKTKTAYKCLEAINVDDLKVTYYDKEGKPTEITEGYTTNVGEIDNTRPGKQKLVVTYEAMKADVELTFTYELVDGESVYVNIGSGGIYNGGAVRPVPEVEIRQTGSASILLKKDQDYMLSYENNINAGEAYVIITGINDYSGSIRKSFTIGKAELTLRVVDTVLAVGDALPDTFEMDAVGLIDGDEDKLRDVSFAFADEQGNTVLREDVRIDTVGSYSVKPEAASDVQIGQNYNVTAVSGTLTIAEERVMYTVVFDMLGQSTEQVKGNFTSMVRSGSLIAEPEYPKLNDSPVMGRVFKGWYKDAACMKAWDFAVDTVQENTTLYARWASDETELRIQAIWPQTYTGSAIKPVVQVYTADGSTLLKAGKDYTIQYYNNVNACYDTSGQPEIGTGGYTDSEEAGGGGFDKTKPYILITGKGNYEKQIYRNFYIHPAVIGDNVGNAAAGFTLKYTDQLVVNDMKEQKPFSSLKYKKLMTAGVDKDGDIKDYQVTISAVEAYDKEGNKLTADWKVEGNQENKWNPAIPKGYRGTFLLIIKGTGNYSGEIKQKVYVANKAALIKNAVISLGKNQKSRAYDNGKAVTLTPGYYDTETKKNYKVGKDGSISAKPEANANDLFTVKSGRKYLVYGVDYLVRYENNKAVGTAAMTITGIGDYVGSKSVNYKITGTAFNTRNVIVKTQGDGALAGSLQYTGGALTQNGVVLYPKGSEDTPLIYGRHYTISYKKNVGKGNATMTFMAKPESGYSGKFNKTFKITAAGIGDPEAVKWAAQALDGAEYTAEALKAGTDEKGNLIYALTGSVPYAKEGAKPSTRLRLTNRKGIALKEGIDYTVSYVNNTAVTTAETVKKPTMTIKGKGNYTGSVKVTFEINRSSMESLQADGRLTVSAAAVAFDEKKADNYEYQPSVTVKDGKKSLGKNEYTVEYKNNTQKAVREYLEALMALEGQELSSGESQIAGDGSAAVWETIRSKRPYAIVRAADAAGYISETGIETDLNIYRTKLTGANLYVVVTEGENRNVYSGGQVIPEVNVYYGATANVSAAKKNKVTDEATLTAEKGTYKLVKLTQKINADAMGDYVLTYGANVAAGKNKGSVTVTGTGAYGSSVTVKFQILSRNIFHVPAL